MTQTIASQAGAVAGIVTNLRIAAGLSEDELAAKCSLDSERVSGIEGATVDAAISELLLIAHVLDRELIITFRDEDEYRAGILNPVEVGMLKSLRQGDLAEAAFSFAWLIADHNRPLSALTEAQRKALDSSKPDTDKK